MTDRQRIKRRLPFDVERCHGHSCQFREQCARYNQRDNAGMWTPFQQGYTGGGEPMLPTDCDRFEPEDEQ